MEWWYQSTVKWYHIISLYIDTTLIALIFSMIPLLRIKYRGYLLFWGEYQIFFIECLENISNFTSALHELNCWYFQHTRWNIFGIYRKKSKFSFYFFLCRVKINFFHSHFSLIAFSGYNIGCKHSLHLETGLKCHFNGWIKRNSRFKKATWSCRRTDVACKLALRKPKIDVKVWRHLLYLTCVLP